MIQRPRSRGLGVKPSLDLFQQSSAGFTGIAGGKLAAQFDHRESRARDLESLPCGRGRGQIGAYQQEVKIRDAHQDQSVAQVVAALNVVSSSAKQFAYVGEHVAIVVDAQNAAAGGDWRFGGGSGA